MLLTGGVGLYFNAIKRGIYERSRRGVFIKIAFFSLSVICLFVSSIASAFCGIQTRLISNILSNTASPCESVNGDCICSRQINSDYTRVHVFENIIYCQSFLINLRTYMYIQCSLNAMGAFASFFAAMLMWRRRYAEFHSGLRFYSYSAALPSDLGGRYKPQYMNGNLPNGIAEELAGEKDTPPHR
ncbi:putative sarcospan [Apostichopus japonicus]|uniref:Putative sarcospan n=1 Tax=Stichopus japonicus TaxID=307972 RepID=A0A2G8LFT1_STIJA|nr:putative sarcospan [Apostichopus japonicus]